MSQEAQMTPQEQEIYLRFYVPAFMEKAAAAGIDLSDPQDLNDALEQAALLKQLEERERRNHIKSAGADLRRVLGVAEPAAPQENYEAAARQLLQNPEMQAAALRAVLPAQA